MKTYLVTVPYATMTIGARLTKAEEFGLDPFMNAEIIARLTHTRASIRLLVKAGSKADAKMKAKKWFDSSTGWTTFTEPPPHVVAEREERKRLRLQKKERGF